MMKRGITADLYVRVSTDDQADKGYSQRSQEEVLRKYCNNYSIEIRNVIYEDHSAKSFNRPEWKKLIQQLKKSKGKIDLILFTKWDRFSRNAGDAYQMISILREIDVEPQAIEQPLDLSIPENKMMLAFYLAAPEVENDRRALNVFYGMRRARKEGRYMGLAPSGKLLTASNSRGRKKYYSYYHCYGGCSYRISSIKALKSFREELQRYVPKKEILDVYHCILTDTYNNLISDVQASKKLVLEQINQYEKRMLHIRDLLATDKIESSDYRDFKAQYGAILDNLNQKLDTLNQQTPSLEALMSTRLENLLGLDVVIEEKASSEDMRLLLSMMYPDKLNIIDDELIV